MSCFEASDTVSTRRERRAASGTSSATPAFRTPARLREPLVDHVVDRRHLRDAGERRRRVERVVQEVDASSARGAWEERLLGQHPSRAAAARPGRGRARRRRPMAPRAATERPRAGEQRQLESRPASSSAGTRRRTYVSPPPVSPGTRWRTLSPTRSVYAARRRVEDGLERALERQPLAVAAEPLGRRLAAARGPASCTRTIAVGEVLRLGRGATTPFSPSLDELAAALSGRRRRSSASPARRPRRRRGRSPRGATERGGRARAAVSPRPPRATKPGRRPLRRARSLRSAAAPRRARARRRRSSPAAPAAARGPAPWPGTTAGTCFSGMWRPAKTTSGSAARLRLLGGSRRALEIVISPAVAQLRPAGARAAARSRARRAGCARQRCASQPNRPATGPR